MSGSRQITWVLLVCTLVAAPAAAGPVTTAITYQGQLKQDGLPANGVFDFRFTLFAPGEIFVSPTTCAFNVPVVNGLFTTRVDFGMSVYSGLALSIDVDVRPNLPGEPDVCAPSPDNFVQLTPHQEITPVPYALHALDAPNGFALDALDGSPSNAVLVDSAGNVGVGTATPQGELDVRSEASNAGGQVRAANSNADTWIMLWSGFSNGSNDPAIIWSDDVAADDLRFLSSSAAGSGGAELMRLTGAGNLGLGTASPARKLHVSSGPSGGTSSNLSDMVVEDDASTFLHLLSPDVHESGILFGDATTSIGGGLVFNATADFLQFRSGGNNTQMTLDADGNLGIGTGVPEGKLHVASGSAGSVTANANSIMVLERSSGGFLSILGPDGASKGILFGNVSDPNSGGIVYDQSSVASEAMQFRTGGNTTRMLIQSNGNIGIGTNAPTGKLHVSGTAADGTVVLPANSISATETLEEAGIASDYAEDSIVIADTPMTLLSRDINVPTSGHVLAIAYVTTVAGISLEDAQVTFFIRRTTSTNLAENCGDDISPTEVERINCHGVFPVSAGTNSFDVIGSSGRNDSTVRARRLTLIFVPTTYGTTDASPPQPNEPAFSETPLPPDENTLTERFAPNQQDPDTGEVEHTSIERSRIEELEVRNGELEQRVARLEDLLEKLTEPNPD